jgi:hypothetical protein
MGHGDRDEDLIRVPNPWEPPAEPSPCRQEHRETFDEGVVLRWAPGGLPKAPSDAALLGHGEPSTGTETAENHQTPTLTSQENSPRPVPLEVPRWTLNRNDEIPGVGRLLGRLKRTHAPTSKKESGEEVEQETSPTGMDAGVTDAQKTPPSDGGAGPDAGVQSSRSGSAAKVDPTPVSHAEGKDIEHDLLAGFLRPYVEKRLQKNVHIEGHIHEHEPEEFRRLYIGYLVHRIDDDTGQRFTRVKAETKERKTHAFRDGTEIHVHKYRGDLATTLHESIHLLSSDRFIDAVYPPVLEGATEFFTRLVCEEQGISRTKSLYQRQLSAIEKLVRLVSKETLAEAYFHGHIKALQQAVDHAKGSGTFARWLLLMRKRNYAHADPLL